MEDYDGKIIIESEIDDSGIDEGLEEISKKLDDFTERTKGRALTDKERQEYDELYSQYEKLWDLDLERSRAQQQITNEIENQKTVYNEFVDGVMTLTDGTRLVKKENEEVTDELKEQNEETRKHVANIDKVGKGLQKVIKRVIRWGLAIIGVRSAYGAIQRAINTVKSNNEEIANTFKVMSIAVANTLTPVVEKIVEILKTVMLYIDYIYFRLTNKHLFNFTKAFEDANKSAKSTAGSVRKMTASFDEMNIIQDTSSGGGAGGMASNPFEGWEDFQPPKWLDKFADKIKKITDFISKNWKIMVAVIAGGVAILLGLKIFNFFKNLGGGAEAVSELGTSFTGFFDSLGKGIEAIAILGGLALVINSVVGLITAFAESGLKLTDVIGLMGTVIGSLIVLITALTIAANALQSPLAMGGLVLITGAIVAILFTIKEVLPTILDAVGKFITEIGPTLNRTLEIIGNSIEKIIYALGTALPPIINSVGSIFEKVFNGISKVISTVGNVIVNIMTTAQNLITTVLNAILGFINKLGPAINNFVDNAITAVTKLINFMISGIEYMINTLVIGALRSFITKINNIIPGNALDLKLPSKVSIERFKPKLFAKGTILNAPGKGVPVGGYQGFAGEAGREAYLPLSDRQLLEELGSTIGKYVVLNANIPVYIGNRLVLREMKRIKAEDDFAYNS